MALVGANFPDIKTPAESGEIINTPVKDLLEQFKAGGENNKKEEYSDKGSSLKHSTATLNQVRTIYIVV